MRYRKPFTAQQRQQAVREYSSFRQHAQLLRKTFAPTNEEQREILARYREHVRAIGAELLRVDSRIDVDELNGQIELAKIVMVEYLRRRQFGD